MLTCENTENPSRGFYTKDENGNRVEVLRISCTLRPPRGMYLNVEVMEPDLVAANMADIQAGMAAFISSAFARADEMGLPVPAAAGGEANA